jgi:hypothetical protein
MNAEVLKQEFIPKYLAVGEARFYRFLLTYALQKLVEMERQQSSSEKMEKTEIAPPDLEFLAYYEKFLVLYRREGEGIYLEIAALFRKAAHRIYRVMLKKNMTPPNRKFLNLVS